MAIVLVLGVLLAGAVFWFIVRQKNMQNWLVNYVRHCLKTPAQTDGPKHILFCFVE